MKENQLLANHLLKLGLNITCIANYITEYNFYDANILKGPYHEWEHLKNEKQSKEELNSYDWENSVGMGTIAGYNNLHVLDIDGCSSYDFVEDLLVILGLPTYYEWVVRSGSQDGFHIYFYSELLTKLQEDQVASTYPPNLDNIGLFEKIELLWRTHVVLPNSLHKSGAQYSFTNCKFPKSIPTIIDIKKFEIIEALFLNISKIEIKKVYYKSSIKKHKDINQPSNIDIIDLSIINKELFFLFDIETDGLIKNGNYPNILQISWVIMDFDGIIYKKNTELINSDFNDQSEAFKINRLKPEIIRKIGRDPEDIFQELCYDLKYCNVISAHNTDFDVLVLQNEFQKYNIAFNFNNIDKFCTMKWGFDKFKNNESPDPKFPKLTEIYSYLFNHEINQLHNSQSDVTILAKCVKEMLYKKMITKDSIILETL
ncbi:exonuclease domain-containing protein [Flavobacterium sp. DSP2-3-1]|uniref:exonuclease domain-containing protein n=1 Tax=Flavobacterium sp. DSP2-3-1 TaxID=2804620 RepID=UPI003CECBE2B